MTRSNWTILALTLLALGLRVYRLEAQSLWSDEGLSLYRARLTLGENLTNVIVVPPGVPTQDTNPPLYFILLSALRAVAGESEFSLRFLSVMAGVAWVPLLYLTGRRLFSAQAGVIAAVLGAFSSFFVWYSQEARMYTLLAALSLASVYLLVRALNLTPASGPPSPSPALPAQERSRGRGGVWFAWVIATAAAIYTHFTAIFLLPFEAIVALVALAETRRRTLYATAGLLIVITTPIIVYGLSRAATGVDPNFGFRTLDSIVEELWSAFSLGWTRQAFQPLWAVAPALAMLVLGLLSGLVEQPRRLGPMLVVAAYLFGVLALFYAATFIRPLYTGPRHLVLIAAPFYLLIGNGLTVAWRRARAVGIAALIWIVAGMIAWRGVQLFDPAYLKDDMRSVARRVSQGADADDLVIVHDAITSFVFDYYYDGAAPWVIIPTYPSLDVDAALAEFQARAQSAARVWFVAAPAPLHGFDPAALDVWARGHLLRLDHASFPSIWLGSAYQLYTARYPILDSLPPTAQARAFAWQGGLRLLGVDPTLEMGETGGAHLALYWTLDAPILGNFITTFRWVDTHGDERFRQAGRVFDNWSARRWPVGKVIRQDVTFDLPPDLPPGEYHVWVSILDRQTQARILMANGSGETEIATLAVPGNE
jgi:uncharacterized membrane protein